MTATLLDAGPLVAFLNRGDRYHRWAIEQMAELEPPLLTCEAVLSEACVLLRDMREGGAAVLELVNRGLVRVAFRLDEQVAAVTRLLVKYLDVPMSLADACLVRMSEQDPAVRVLTLDRDFQVYRRHGRQLIPVIMPGAR
jgi:predicted nucleic acid-binding protein